jgi:hypothetical protein
VRLLATFPISVLVASALAWQVAAPVPRGEPAPDGRTYLLVNPLGERHLAACVLVERRAGAPPWSAPTEPPPSKDPPPPLRPSEGDRVLSSVERPVPVDQRCLDGARGYVLFDTHAQPGYGVVLERRDRAGKVAWAKRLEDLFPAEVVKTFVDLGGAKVWAHGWWLDGERGEIAIVARRAPLRRVALEDGSLRDDPVDEAALLRERVASGRESERRAALAAAEERDVVGLPSVLEREMEAGEGRSEAWRVEVAAAILRRSDHARAWDALLETLRPDRAEPVRRAGANALRAALASAPVTRRSQVLARAKDVGSPEARWLVENAGS